ncbi:hypothetical protein GQ55_5G291000 [Panicum hallii var. hallii]|uniref:Uncharacterized protein n=1 Tax=Panicum hallii var. hallii TaxID=1504633 RepID=A0A2T7DLB5_9POAL|nr:hypothetical protein GQ55_5G291000 [Panicum hallii var. hallii]
MLLTPISISFPSSLPTCSHVFTALIPLCWWQIHGRNQQNRMRTARGARRGASSRWIGPSPLFPLPYRVWGRPSRW